MNKLKKFICLALVICFMVPAVLLLSACGEDPNTAYVSTFDELVEALTGEKTTIQLTADISSTKSIIISKKITLNLNGKTLTGNGYDGVLQVTTTGDLTIKGNGKVVAVGGYSEEEVFDANSTAETLKNDEYTYAVWARGGKVLIENGEFSNTTVKDDEHYDLIYASEIKNKETNETISGEITILGGKYKNVTPKWTLNIHDKSQSKIIVKGGEFENYDPANSKTENPAVSFVADGYKSILKDGTTDVYVVVAE